ncbi:sphingolipid delta-4 desaturase [Chitinophaga sp. CF118]|uniref:fatty acid desaturase n=1 Tax=Chitinophaga sp. CF118 TaxID=1884367 RepID=UPI0008E40ED9|nr:fatty acid desaturase [Chitinophaga sp. CF118]SFD62948.1 sphingolipid delta-4 desaturase [Chitinophaga sp. CF118]
MRTKPTDFTWSKEPNPHHVRVRQILKQHPEMKELIGKNPYTIFMIIGLVAAQVGISYFLKDTSWWLVFLVAYAVGAFISHALWVMIHESSHGLIFRGKVPNLMAGILANLPHIFASSVSFQRYHLKHHAHQGEHDLDADLPDFWEARLVSNNPLGKMIWFLFFPVFQVTRTARLNIALFDRWILLNWIIQLSFNVALFVFIGPKAFVYMLASFFFSVGLHPLGARWIQEHYLTLDPVQETYSYYGPLNKVAFNVGFHNEHHDFPSIPWNKLPQIKSKAPAYYDSLLSHQSWTKLFLSFIFNPKLSLYSRMLRKEKVKIVSDKEVLV